MEKTEAVAEYKRKLKDANDNVVMDTNDARVFIPKKPVPSVKVSDKAAVKQANYSAKTKSNGPGPQINRENLIIVSCVCLHSHKQLSGLIYLNFHERLCHQMSVYIVLSMDWVRCCHPWHFSFAFSFHSGCDCPSTEAHWSLPGTGQQRTSAGPDWWGYVHQLWEVLHDLQWLRIPGSLTHIHMSAFPSPLVMLPSMEGWSEGYLTHQFV